MSSLGNITEFPENASCSVNHDGRDLLVVRRGDALFVYENRCPHTRESLDPMGGSVASDDGLLLTCQRHAAQFRLDNGECVGGPCLGEQLEAVAVIISQGEIYLD